MGAVAVVAVAVVAVVSMTTACPRHHAAPADAPASPEARSAAALSELFATSLASIAGPVHGDTVTVGRHALTVHAKSEGAGGTTPDGRTVAGVEVICDVDGQVVAAFHTGAVAVDATPEAARKAAAAEWASIYGWAIVDALAEKPAEYEVAGFAIHAGLTGVLGPKPDGVDGLDPVIFGLLEPELAELLPSRAGFHSITIDLTTKADGTQEGDYWVDDDSSSRLADALHALPWPTSARPYTVKKFYVLVAR
ncbi:MAG TPA: DUF6348 family protein [Kofleriaceae bacterium]|nr:DUF6348 family protein [Kofleriaceae bacterium]